MCLVCLWAGACGDPSPDASIWDPAPSVPLDLRASLSAEEVPLMGEVTLTLDLYRQAELDLEFLPPIPDGFSGERVQPLSQPLHDGIWERHVLRLRPLRKGTLAIGPFTARAEGPGEVATTAELTLEVTSLLTEAGEEIEAPAPPFPSPFPWQRWIPIAAAALVVVTACFLLWRNSRRRQMAHRGDEVPLPPHIKALRELARLREAPRRTPEEVEVFYIAVSHVLRVYLEERFGLHAPERTTEEFLAEVESGDSLLTGHRNTLRQFLEQCDLVKFANLFPAPASHEETFRIAEQFVENTRPDRISQGAA